MTPASRSRVGVSDPRMQLPPSIEFRTIYEAKPVEQTLTVEFVSPPERPQ